VPHHKTPETYQQGQALICHYPLCLPPGAVTGIGSLPFRDPHTAVQWVAQTCPLIPFWPELPRRSLHARSVEQTFGAFADLVRPCRTGSGYEVVPGQLVTLLERLEQAPARLEPARSAGFFAFEQAMTAGRFAHAVAVKGQLIGPLTLAGYPCVPPFHTGRRLHGPEVSCPRKVLGFISVVDFGLTAPTHRC
jgi:hypothetical protein